MDDVTLGVIRILIFMFEIFVRITIWMLKIFFWISNKLRMTAVVIWIIGLFASTEIDWCKNTSWFYTAYYILGAIIFVVSVLCLIGAIVSVFESIFCRKKYVEAGIPSEEFDYL